MPVAPKINPGGQFLGHFPGQNQFQFILKPKRWYVSPQTPSKVSARDCRDFIAGWPAGLRGGPGRLPEIGRFAVTQVARDDPAVPKLIFDVVLVPPPPGGPGGGSGLLFSWGDRGFGADSGPDPGVRYPLNFYVGPWAASEDPPNSGPGGPEPGPPLHCSINSFRFLAFLLWFVLGPGGLRRPTEGSGGASWGSPDPPGPGKKT